MVTTLADLWLRLTEVSEEDKHERYGIVCGDLQMSVKGCGTAFVGVCFWGLFAQFALFILRSGCC